MTPSIPFAPARSAATRQPAVALLASLLLALAACSTPGDRAEDLLQAGQPERALALLDAALREKPGDSASRATWQRARDALAAQSLLHLDLARSQGRLDLAVAHLQRLQQLAPQHPRLPALQADLAALQRQQQVINQAQAALTRSGPDGMADRQAARAALQALLASQPDHAAARALLQRLADAPATAAATNAAAASLPLAMAAAYQKPVSLEFRDAPLRTVFEALSRSTQVNVVFDKDVRADAKVTVFLRGVTLDEAVRVVLATQQLDRKLLNENTLLVYPNTTAKQREHQDLVTRSIYLVNADVRQVQALVRGIAKTRDIHVDERLNMLLVRDTPQVVALIEHLVASVDLPEPEVMLEVEVMEVASSQLDELGLNWPEKINLNLVDALGNVPVNAVLNSGANLRASVANPGLVAMLKGSSGTTHVLANPSIRARNREKARVQVGQKLPVFTTSAIANVEGVSTTVSYVDVGLKLDVEPTVQLDNDVTMKIALEVTNLLNTVSGPGGSVAYEVGTRSAATSLRLRDGETQILAGLVRDEDRLSNAGIPGLSRMPLLGRLFGVRTDKRDKSEVVLLITPRVLRNLAPPLQAMANRAAGTDSSPGSEPLRLRPQARASVGAARVGGAAAAAGSSADPAATPEADAEAGLALVLDLSDQAQPGGTVAFSLRHEGLATVSGEIVFDPQVLEGPPGSSGRLPFELPPRGQMAQVLRVKPDAPAGSTAVSVNALSARGTDGASVAVRLQGSGLVQINRVPGADKPASP